jgi:phage terminase small subunit
MLTSLNPRQTLFVEHYLIDLNGKEAALRAGYTSHGASVRAAKLLAEPLVAAAVGTAMAARAARTGITAQRVLDEYARIAFVDVRCFIDRAGKAMRLRASKALLATETCAIAELVDGRAARVRAAKGKVVQGGLRRVKLFDKMAALRSLGRIIDGAGMARFAAATDASVLVPSFPFDKSSDALASIAALSERQRRFAEEFLVDFDASAAAIRAGYAPRGAPFLATKLRRYPGVAALIAQGIEARRMPIRIEADRVLLEYARIAFADIGRIADWNAKGLRIKPKHRIARDDAAAIADLDMPPGTRLRLRLHDKVYALDMLARHLGLLEPRMPGRALTQAAPVQRTRAALRQRLGLG